MRSTRRATIRQHEALGSSIQHAAGGVPIAGISGSGDGGAFQRSDDATVFGIVTGGG